MGFVPVKLPLLKRKEAAHLLFQVFKSYNLNTINRNFTTLPGWRTAL